MDFDELFNSVLRESGSNDDRVVAFTVIVEAAMEIEFGGMPAWRARPIQNTGVARVYAVAVDALAQGVAHAPDPENAQLRQLAQNIADRFLAIINRATHRFLERQELRLARRPASPSRAPVSALTPLATPPP